MQHRGAHIISITQRIPQCLSVLALFLGIAAGLDPGPAGASPPRPHTAKTVDPCSYVTAKQATLIVGKKLTSRREGPLGPTCIYTFKGQSGSITLVVETAKFSQIAIGMRHTSRFAIYGRRTVCGTLGGPNLFTSLPHGEVLNVAARCTIAKNFSAAALAHLGVRRTSQ